MGGRGSGRWYRWGARDTVEEARRLDVRSLYRAGLLVPDEAPRGWGWRSARGSHSIDVHAGADALTLFYRWRIRGGEWEDVRQRVGLSWTVPHFGGRRPWFLCPGAGCGRRVALLFGAGRLFLCRHCYRLAYTSTREDLADRALRRANRIRARLGGEPGTLNPFPPKPKGMHWRTYSRLRLEGEDAALRSLTAALARFAPGAGG